MSNDTTKADVKHNKVNLAILWENNVFSIHKAHYSKLAEATLPSFVASSKGFLQEESNLSRVHRSDDFHLNAYKLMEKSGYDFNNHHL